MAARPALFFSAEQNVAHGNSDLIDFPTVLECFSCGGTLGIVLQPTAGLKLPTSQLGFDDESALPASESIKLCEG
jgi:hypothetical protein